MDILDALDEGLLAIDANSQVSYLNQTASQILQIDQVKAVGRLSVRFIHSLRSTGHAD
ncbi:MAG: PAS domain-containing protein [Evtepia sp.]